MAFWKKKESTDTEQKKKKPVWREWLDAALFAIVAATLIRTFFFEAYTIPTGSMEGTMLVNDYLFVSKLAYGPRVPMTPIAVPLVHNTMPMLSAGVIRIIVIIVAVLFGSFIFKKGPSGKVETRKQNIKKAVIGFFTVLILVALYWNFCAGNKSYTDSVQWKYHRIWDWGKVERNDVVVFNYPAGDTVIAENPENGDFYRECRMYGREKTINHSNYTIITRPVDKKENYIKRCIGLPGDVLEIKDARVYINGQPNELYPHSKLNYMVKTSGRMPLVEDNLEMVLMINNGQYLYNLENCQVDEMKKASNVTSCEKYIGYGSGVTPPEPSEWVFPFDTANYKWNRDNFGPLTIPKKGVTINLTPQNIAIYRRVIRNYEGNKLEEQNGKFIINGKEATSYTFNMDYYWMMGDNRHNSLDSRYWGFVPIDHVVGKAWFVWLSYGENGIRWKRIFRGIGSLQK